MQITNYRNAVAKLKGILDNRASYLIIHYSCESFRERNQAKSPRITSIAIRSLESGQIESFSIHKIAEKKGVPLEQISDHYNELEYDMLCEYMTFLEKRDDKTFIHWNMRDINYGFHAIEHRFEVLCNEMRRRCSDGVQPVELYKVADDHKIDLFALLIQKYGQTYIDDPRMPSLINLNGITPVTFLTGAEEAAAFENRDFIRLHQSTLGKVATFEKIIELASRNKLKTNTKWYEQCGCTPQEIFDFAKTNWIAAAILTVLSMIGGIVLGRLSNYLFPS